MRFAEKLRDDTAASSPEYAELEVRFELQTAYYLGKFSGSCPGVRVLDLAQSPACKGVLLA